MYIQNYFYTVFLLFGQRFQWYFSLYLIFNISNYYAKLSEMIRQNEF